jgi:hypothetical protein
LSKEFSASSHIFLLIKVWNIVYWFDKALTVCGPYSLSLYRPFFMAPGSAAHARPPLFQFAVSRNAHILFQHIAVSRRFCSLCLRKVLEGFSLLCCIWYWVAAGAGNGPSARRHVSHLTNTLIARQICIRNMKTLHPECGFGIFL